MSTDTDPGREASSAQVAPRSPRRSWVWTLSLSLSVALCVGLWGGGNWLVWKRVGRQAFPVTAGELQVSGLAEAVQVERDARGIPHVAAASESDAWATLGFVHAQDRLTQMLWLRRMARGRTAEVAGERGLAADRLSRTLGIGRLADAEFERLPPEVRSVLEAYAAGVNARMERIRQRAVGPPRGLPPQDTLLESWQPSDSLAISKLLAWAASPEPQTQIVLEALLERLGSVGARPFFPTGSGVQGISVPFDPPPPAADAEARARADWQPDAPGDVSLGAVALYGTAWALLPEATANGAALLGVDFQLTPSAPALLYEAFVQGGELEVAGLTVPGVPVFWAGRNRDVAWAALPAGAVTADLYRERVRPPSEDEAGPGSYRKGRQWLPLEFRREEIRVAGADGTLRDVTLSVLSTHHGPLLDSDSLLGSAPGSRDPLAIRWTGFEAGDGIGGLLGVAHAKNVDQLRRALAAHHEPVVRVLFAAASGEVGVQTAGWLSRRLLPTGVLPVTGSQLGFDWRDPVDFATPGRRSGSKGKTRPTRASTGVPWRVVADAPIESSIAAGGIEWLWRTGDEASHLERRLRKLTSRGPVELWEAAAMQRDLTAEVPRPVVEAVLELAGDPAKLGSEAREVTRMLDHWNGELRPDSQGATVYVVFLDHLLKSLFAPTVGPLLLQRYLELEHVRPGSIAQAVLLAASTRPAPGGWSDREGVERAVRESLLRASRTLGFRFGANRDRWIWAERHPIEFTSLVPASNAPSRAEPLSALAFSSTSPLSFRSLASGFVRFEPGALFEVRSVTTARLLIDLSDRSRLLTVLAPGQSEHPGHPHYADGTESWQAGQHRSLVMSPFLVGEATVQRLVLRPRR